MGYSTKQGELVAKILKANPEKHLSAEKITQILAESGEAVGKTTVYRHLDKLVRSGEIKKFLDNEEAVASYQYCGLCAMHYHFKCYECGLLLHLECDFLNEVNAHMLEHHGFEFNGSKTVLCGICKDCRKAAKPDAEETNNEKA